MKKMAKKNWAEKKMGRKKIGAKKKIWPKKFGRKNIGRYIGRHTHRATPPYTPALPLLKNYTKIA
jgi:hypothetical protein